MAVDILLLDPHNLALLSNVAPDVFDHAIDKEQLDRFVADPRHAMLLAVESDTVVGMLSAVEYFHPDKPPQLWINEVAVASTHRNRGIGRRLVNAALDLASERGCACAWLGTSAENTAAQHCFGSVKDRTEPQPFLLYEWELDDR